MSRYVRIILIVLCACVCVFTGYTIISSFVSDKEADKIYGTIQNDVSNILSPDQSEDESNDISVDIWTREYPSVTTNEPSESSDVTTDSKEPVENVTTIEPGSDSDTTAEPSESITESREPRPSVSETSEIPEPAPGPEIMPSMIRRMSTYIKSLKAKSKDVIGMIHIPITYGGKDYTISYPVVLTDNNDFYLDHDIYGNHLNEGSIFADCSCKTNVLDNRNLLLHGHNMFQQTMFHQLHKFLSSEVFYKSYIYFFTEDGVYIYEPYSAYITSPTSQYAMTYFASDTDYLDYLNTTKRNSNPTLYKENISLNSNDYIITLSTCSGVAAQDRLAVHGILIKKVTLQN